MSQSGSLYTDLSCYYDLFCAEVDYAEQCAFALRAFYCFGNPGGKQYLDLACGTGSHLRIMQDYGFIATGLDNSAEMLGQTARRCPDATCILCDMSALQAECSYDLVSCFLYSIHYNTPASGLRQTLKRVFDALKRGGVFIFDAVDVTGINNRHFVRTQVNADNSTLNFESGWTYAGSGEQMTLHLSISEQTDKVATSASTHRVWHDRHTMTAIHIAEIKNWLQETGFEVTLFEHDYSRLKPWSGNSFNIIVVACKPQ